LCRNSYDFFVQRLAHIVERTQSQLEPFDGWTVLYAEHPLDILTSLPGSFEIGYGLKTCV
jgi:hypothetical protein